MSGRIDVSINESGTQTVLNAINKLAAACQTLSPTTAASLRGTALRVGVNTDKMVKEVAIAVLDTIVHRTPRDTGRARANWTVVIARRRTITDFQWEKYDYEGDATVAEGASKIRGTKRELGQTIFISNALPYIQALNEGWSKQAAEMFVETAVQAGIQVATNYDLVK